MPFEDGEDPWYYGFTEMRRGMQSAFASSGGQLVTSSSSILIRGRAHDIVPQAGLQRSNNAAA